MEDFLSEDDDDVSYLSIVLVNNFGDLAAKIGLGCLGRCYSFGDSPII